jgi:hypothetical protein
VFPDVLGLVVVPVVPVAAGVFPEFPGAGDPPTTGAGEEATTTGAFTGVVANVTNVEVFLTTAGVCLVVAAALAVLPPPEEPPEEPLDALRVHCATHVIAAAVIVTVAPAEIVEPLLQLQPANV